MIFAWWMACLADAYRSVYYRRKPMLCVCPPCSLCPVRWCCGSHAARAELTRHVRRDDDDYDIDFYTVGPVPPDRLEPQGQQPSPREQLEVRRARCRLRAACWTNAPRTFLLRSSW